VSPAYHRIHSSIECPGTIRVADQYGGIKHGKDKGSQSDRQRTAGSPAVSRQKGIDLRLVRDPFQAAQILEELEVGQGLTNV
jgi:hypothetical protein